MSPRLIIILLGMGLSARAGAAATCLERASAGVNHSCAVAADGSIQCWGSNEGWDYKLEQPVYGALGTGGTASSSRPVPGMLGVAPAAEVSTGNGFTCARKADGSVWCSGGNFHGQLGDGTTVQRLTPVKVVGLDNAVQVVTGEKHTCALLRDGTVSCWGSNSSFQLGGGSLPGYRTTPAPVAGLSGVVELASGWRHVCARRTDGTLWCWGANSAGQLGSGDTAVQVAPIQVSALGNRVARVALGAGHSCALDTEGAVWCWGSNLSGQLGQPGVEPMDLLPPPTYVEVCIGWPLCSGVGTAVPVPPPPPLMTPTRVPLLESVSAVFSGPAASSTCASRVDGSLLCWGENWNGQLGNGTFRNRAREAIRALGEGWGQASLGLEHTCASRADGSLWCWGWDADGQVGDGDGPARCVLATGGDVCVRPLPTSISPGCR